MTHYDTLLRQAPMTAEVYMDAAIRYLDEKFHQGFASNHPEFVRIYVEAFVRDFHTGALVHVLEVGAVVHLQKS
jgi:hypothetical protein